MVTLAGIMSLLNTNDLHQIFENLDKNGDGLVSLEELNWLLEKTGVKFSLGELESVAGGKSRFDFNEFLFFCDSISEQNNGSDDEDENEESDLVNAFKVFDLNGDGFISCEELQNVLSRLELWDASSGWDCRAMIGVYDTNLDGQLDFEEFKNMMLIS
jgi:calcium-binding protein CML